MATSIWFWVLFNLFVLGLLVIDLGVFHRKAHAVSIKEAGIWTVVWVTLALLFMVGLYVWEGKQYALQFLAGYLIEKSLSVDNIFVFVMLFSYFQVPAAYQHRVLFWGILGALIMRGAMIGAGSILIAQFHWILYLFGIFLVITGVRMAFQREDAHKDLGQSPVVRGLARLLPITDSYHEDRFLIRQAGRLMATPMLVVLLVVETTDLLFAFDSIPAVFAVTQDPFLVYTSNIFAILGLRSLYFLLANVINRFRFLKYGLAIILTFVGIKMLVADFYHISIGASLGVISGVLALSVLLSAFLPEPKFTPVTAENRVD